MRITHPVLVLAAVGLPMASLNAQSATTGPSQEGPGIVVKGQKEKKVCKTMDAPTGSRVGQQRVCRTEADWTQEERTAQRVIDQELQRSNRMRAEIENAKNLMGRPH